MPEKVYITDKGTDIILDLKIDDLADANSIAIFIQKPDGVVIERIGYVYGDAADGKIHYVTQAGDIDQGGTYSVQGKVTFVTGDKDFASEIVTFNAYERLQY